MSLWKSFFVIAVGGATLLAGASATARQVFYPKPAPEATLYGPTEAPQWLKNGKGDDGYLRVAASTSMRNGCIPLGSAGFLKTVASEEMQLTVSVKVVGISSPMQGREIPIAIIDGRSNPGGCVPLTMLDSAMAVVPLAKLQTSGPATPDVTFDVIVRSTSEKKLNIVGPAQVVLGVATVFATGGAATTVAGLTSALAQPAFKQLEQVLSAADSGVTPGISRARYDWSEIRELKRLTVPVYLSKTKNFESDAVAIPRLQQEAKTTDPEFTVDLVVRHFPTAFDITTAGDTGRPDPNDISGAKILAHPNQAGVPSLSQLLDPAVNSLAKASNGAEITDGCRLILESTSSAGFALQDRAMALVSAMNKVRPSAWYQSAELNTCTVGNGSVKTAITRIYGESQVAFRYDDARDRQERGDDRYASWIATGVPVLDTLRKALTESTPEERERLLMKLSASADITLDAPLGADEWPIAIPTDNAAPAQLPQLKRLAARGLASAGCFAYRNDAAFQPNSNAGEMLLLDKQGRIWVASALLSAAEGSRLSSLSIFRLDDNWKKFYKSYVDYGSFGSPVRGGCSQIAPKL